MDILAAIKREERKLEKQLGKLQHKLNGVRAAAKVLGNSTSKEIKGVKKRVMSAAARAKIGKAALDLRAMGTHGLIIPPCQTIIFSSFTGRTPITQLGGSTERAATATKSADRLGACSARI